MANRQDSGSNSAHENQRPTSQNEDAVPEMTDNIRGREENEDEFDVDRDEDMGDMDDTDVDEDDEGNY
jgi:hypothetical protein